MVDKAMVRYTGLEPVPTRWKRAMLTITPITHVRKLQESNLLTSYGVLLSKELHYRPAQLPWL